MNYIFFISKEFCDMFSKYSEGTRKRYKYIMNSYLKYLRKQDNRFNSVNVENQEQYIVKNYLSKYPFKVEDYCTFADAIECDNPCCSAALFENQEKINAEYYICFPIYTIDLKIIIHEINHALNINTIGYTDDELIMQCLFKTESCEELVNDYIAELVLNAFIEMGGVIPKSLRRINIGNEYVYKDYIVSYLFDCLADLLLESRISGNFNLFYELVGRDKTSELEQIMDDLYQKDYFAECLFNELINLINEIYEKVINTEPKDIQEQIDLLEIKVYRIRRLRKKNKECEK